MKANSRKKAMLLLTVMLLMFILTGCKGDKIDNNNISINYNKRIESIEVTNKSDIDVYASFYVVLLDKDDEILAKETYNEKKLTVDQMYSIDLEDIKPEWLEYDRVDSMDAEVTEVFEEDKTKNTFRNIIIIVIIIILAYIYVYR